MAGYDSHGQVSDCSYTILMTIEAEMSRFAEPKEIGDLAVLLCSERNTPWMTGSDVVIDGGESLLVSRGLDLN